MVPRKKLVQVLGPGCPRCTQLKETVEAAARELGVDAAVQAVTQIDAILAFDVLMTPALVIDGVVKLVGRVPSSDEIKMLLAEGP